ncbi:hypothetical protein GDO78_002880 [Eleutherodactylus coqui]|uniref:Uncharacterized protein n=1 Tax=Eleutherodactylus coqui TaxID=57060 RepID=A0A8J6K1N4_ELECQ|nr:hypothetical protein GDO78_002880 [Eleutherodactylus coqui]
MKVFIVEQVTYTLNDEVSSPAMVEESVICCKSLQKCTRRSRWLRVCCAPRPAAYMAASSCPRQKTRANGGLNQLQYSEDQQCD